MLLSLLRGIPGGRKAISEGMPRAAHGKFGGNDYRSRSRGWVVEKTWIEVKTDRMNGSQSYEQVEDDRLGKMD